MKKCHYSMMQTAGMTRAAELMSLHLAHTGKLSEFDLLGRRWVLCDDVFAPIYSPVTEFFTAWLPYPKGGAFLEIGCGTGVTAVTAALCGCASVTASDITGAAVENTKRNVALHDVGDIVRVVQSDLFSQLDAKARFDLIFWNSNFVETPARWNNSTALHHAFYDPGYRTHERYLREAPARLTRTGRLFLGFSNLGNYERIVSIATRLHLRVSTLQRAYGAGVANIEFLLLEFRSTQCPETMNEDERQRAV